MVSIQLFALGLFLLLLIEETEVEKLNFVQIVRDEKKS